MNKHKISNNELLDLLEERLIEKGIEHPDDRSNMFLHEVFERLEEPELDWESAGRRLREYKMMYATISGGNIALQMFIIPMENRFKNGERTRQLYDEIMSMK